MTAQDRLAISKLMESANAMIRTTDIKGKSYAEVPQRIKAFRSVFPDGYISTEMLSNENGVCVFKAECGIYEGGEPLTLGVGHAYEKESSSFINKTSYIENCETSAVGRALGMAGFGIDVSVASAEEVQTAIINQTKDEPKPDLDYTQEVTPKDYAKAKRALSKPITNEQLRFLMDAVEHHPEVAQYIADKFGGASNMTESQAQKIIDRLKAKDDAGA